MSPRSRIPALLALLLLLLAAAAPAQTEGAGGQPGQELSVYLLTMGRGDQVWEKFGHNAIWVRDPVAGTDWVYNYGVFDFHSPGYWGRFVKGTWLYQLAAYDIYQTMAQYQYLNRTVVAQELNLTPEQKQELQAFLQWNLRPENAEYVYDYYRDNCSTRIRDVLDRALGGQLRAATAGVATPATYRWHSQRLLRDDVVTYTGLQAGLGPAADRRISAWEEMFLPDELYQRVAALRVTGADGRRVPLVAREQVLFEAVGRPADPRSAPSWIPRYLLVGAALGAALAGLARAARGSRAARIGFATLAALWTLVAGTGGVLLVGLWGFTNHSIAYRNENLLQLSPLALPLVVLLPALVFGARWAARPARWLTLAVAASAVLGLLLQPLPGLDQVNGEIIALSLPVSLALAWAVVRLLPGSSTTLPVGEPDRAPGQRARPALKSR